MHDLDYFRQNLSRFEEMARLSELALKSKFTTPSLDTYNLMIMAFYKDKKQALIAENAKDGDSRHDTRNIDHAGLTSKGG